MALNKKIVFYSAFLIIFFLFSSCAGLIFNSPPLNVLETNHFTFFYAPNSAVEKDINYIVRYSELAIDWFTAYTGLVVTAKPDVYVFDSENKSPYNNLTDIIDPKFMDSNSTKGVITFYYKENNYIEASSTILHETIHVIQDYILNLKSIGIAEGYTSLLSLKYYFYLNDYNYTDENIFSMLSGYVAQGIKNGDGLPSYLFTLSIPEFNGVSINQDGIGRDPKFRYEISETFIAYLTINYGINLVTSWLVDTTTTNFKQTFYRTFPTNYDQAELDWYAKVMKEIEY